MVTRAVSATTPAGEAPIIAFCHVPKTGGTTITNVLREVYGLSHCRVIASTGDAVTARDLALAAKLTPRLRVVSGHGLLPHVDYGAIGGRLRWLAMLREPAERFHSQYRHVVRAGRTPLTFAEWCAAHGARRGNLLVRWMAGALDVDLAKRIAAERFTAIGDQADLDVSLAIFAARIGDGRMPTSTSRVDNAGRPIAPAAVDAHRVAPGVAPGAIVPSDAPELFDRELALRYNRLDDELYRWFRETIWPAELRDVAALAPRPHVPTVRTRARSILGRAYQGLVYRPVANVAGRRAPAARTDRAAP